MIKDVIVTKEHAEMHNNAVQWRGEIIYHVTILERLMDVFIAGYFCSKGKKEDMIGMVLGNNRISLDGKRKLLDTVLKKTNPYVYKKYPDYSTHFNTAIRERNVFAHCTLAYNEEALEKSKTHIGFIKFSTKTRIDWYDEKKLESIIVAISYCCNVLKELIKIPSETTIAK